MVCDPHLAEDVTQGVFLALARQAGGLRDRAVLAGWLHRTTQHLAANTVRSEVRRRAREQEATMMNELSEPDLVWHQIAPLLDAALCELNESDRDAVLLRYFERRSAREMAGTLGISEEAAQKRVNRAVERLRNLLAKRGVPVEAAGLAVAMSCQAVQSAPVGLLTSISGSVGVVAASISTAAVETVTQTILMTTGQRGIAAGPPGRTAHRQTDLAARLVAATRPQRLLPGTGDRAPAGRSRSQGGAHGPTGPPGDGRTVPMNIFRAGKRARPPREGPAEGGTLTEMRRGRLSGGPPTRFRHEP
jgi:RNA polymerase sigma factor (sigma-70 family)